MLRPVYGRTVLLVKIFVGFLSCHAGATPAPAPQGAMAMPKAPLASATLLPAVLPHAPGEGHHSWKMPFRFICKIQKQRGLLPLLEEHCKSRAKCLLMERMPKLKRCNIRVVKLLHYRSSTAQTTGEDFSQGDGEDLSLSCLPMTLTCCMQLPHLLPRSLLHRHNFWWRKQSRPSLPQLLVSLLL